MKFAVCGMAKRYNGWRDKPIMVPIATSAQAVLKGLNMSVARSSCKGGCGAECSNASCVSCKSD